MYFTSRQPEIKELLEYMSDKETIKNARRQRLLEGLEDASDEVKQEKIQMQEKEDHDREMAVLLWHLFK